MFFARRTFALTFILITFGISTIAQSGDVRTDLPNRLRHSGKIYSSYDRFEDITMLAVGRALASAVHQESRPGVIRRHNGNRLGGVFRASWAWLHSRAM